MFARLAIAVGLLASAAPAAADLEKGFQNPPMQARLRCYWWWLNSNVTKEAITRDLEEMRKQGYAGAIVIDAGGAEQRNNRQVPAGPVFGGPEWRELFRHAMAEASRLDLELSLNILSGWNLGGPAVTPDHAAKHITFSRAVIQGPTRMDDVLTTPESKFQWYRDIAILAYPLKNGPAVRRPIRDLALKMVAKESGGSMPLSEGLLTDVEAQAGEADAGVDQVVDLTSKFANGRLVWDVPAGQWEILRIGYTPSGEVVSTGSQHWKGLVIDYLSTEAFDAYWDRVVTPILDDARGPSGRSLKYLVTDSWEAGGMNWTPVFREEFRRRRGYDAVRYLPVLAGRLIESRDVSNRFLTDFRRTVADLIGVHYEHFLDRAKSRGLGTHPEGGGPHGAPIDALLNLGRSSFPQMEYWAKANTHRVRDQDRFFGKEAASAAHIYGKTYVAAEGMTTIGPHWEESIWDNLKPTFDRAVCEGVNLLIWHTFTCSPKDAGLPGQEYFAGTHLNPNVTWWRQSAAFLGYINRIQFLMQQGHFVADVLYYHGDHVPSFVRLKPSDPAGVLPGYDYDVCNEDVLLNRLSVKDGRLVLPDGMSYRVLVLPGSGTISPAALRKVSELAKAGALVVGPKPGRATGLLGDDEVTRMTAELWGRTIHDTPAKAVLAEAGVVPDFEARGAVIDYIHRRTADADIFFLSNQSAEGGKAQVFFRVTGKQPELWDAATGAVQDLLAFRATQDGRTSTTVEFDPYGSAVVVFRRAGRPRYASVSAQRTARHAVEGPWTVYFAAGWGAPAKVEFPTLMTWTAHENEGIRYFSGTARYEKEIDLPAALFAKGGRIELDLGDVRELAEVTLNGVNLGVVWKVPRTVDITKAAKPGANRLEVSVTNLWPNRLIGDQRLPEGERKTRTNITKFTANSPLIPSGLLGPVEVRRVETVTEALQP